MNMENKNNIGSRLFKYFFIKATQGLVCHAENLSEDSDEEREIGRCLFSAIRKGDIDTLEMILHHNDNVSMVIDKNNKDNTLLHYAVERNRESIVKLLIDYVDINKQNCKGNTPLHIAVDKGYLNIVRVLLCRNCEVNIVNNDRMTPLMIAESDFSYNAEIINELMLCGAQKLSLITCKNELRRAVQAEEWGTIKNLIETAVSLFASEGWWILNKAVGEKRRDVIRYVVSKVDELEQFDAVHVLHLSCQGGEMNIVQYLIEQGVDVTATVNQMSIIHKSVMSDDESTISEVIDVLGEKPKEMCEIVTNTKDFEANTPLMWAVKEGKTAAVQTLLYKCHSFIDINCQNLTGDTALHMAVKTGNLEIVKLLLDNKANVNIKNSDHCTPVELVTDNALSLKILSLIRYYGCMFDIIHDGKMISITDVEEFIKNNINIRVLTVHYKFAMKESFLTMLSALRELFFVKVIITEDEKSDYSVSKELRNALENLNKPLILQCGSIVYIKESNTTEIVQINLRNQVNILDENIYIEKLSTKTDFSMELVIEGLQSRLIGEFCNNNWSLDKVSLISKKHFDNWKLIDYALLHDNILVVKFLTLFPLNILEYNENYERTIDIAAQYSSVETLGALLQVPVCDVDKGLGSRISHLINTSNEMGNTPLLIAAECGKTDTMDFLIKCGSNIKHYNNQRQSAVDLTWTKQHYKSLLLLLQKDSDIPSDFDMSSIEDGPEHQNLLLKFFQQRDKLHSYVESNDLKQVQEMVSKRNSKYYLNSKGQSILLTSIVSERFDIYAFLKSINLDFKNNEEREYFHCLREDQKVTMKTSLLKYFSPVKNPHILYLVSRSRIIGSVAIFEEKIKDLYKKLDNSSEISLILQLIQYCDYVDIIFDFSSESVVDMDPTSSTSTKGKCDYREGRLYICTSVNEDEILGTLAHELAHLAMQIKYNNNCNPFGASDKNCKARFDNIVDDVHKKSDVMDDIIRRVFTVYKDDDWPSELIVRVPHLLAKYSYREGMEIIANQIPAVYEFYKNPVMEDFEKFITDSYLIKPRNNILLLNQYSRQIETVIESNIHFKDCINIDDFLSSDINVLLLTTESTWLSNISVYSALQTLKYSSQNCLFFKFDQYAKHMSEVNKAFYSDICHLLVLEYCPSTCGTFQTAWRELKNLLKSKNTKKIIFIINKSEFNKLQAEMGNIKYKLEEDTYLNFANCLPDSQEMILNKRSIQFQGSSSRLSLKYLLFGDTLHEFSDDNIEKISSLLSVEALENIVKGDNICVGNEFIGLGEIQNYYIHRKFKNHKKDNYLSEYDFVKSTGCKTVIISDTAGMGKSTVLTHLGEILKENHPNIWILRINLNDYTKVLSIETENETKFNNHSDVTVNSDEAVTFLLDKLLIHNTQKLTNFEKNFFKYCFQNDRKMVLMIDGFDEISPYYDDVVTGLMAALQNTKVEKLFVTTRPHRKQELQETLSTTSASTYSLKPFSEEDQLEFLMKFWQSHNSDLNDLRKLKIYAKLLIKKLSDSVSDRQKGFTGIPLQTRMLAEAFEEDMEVFYTSDGVLHTLPDKIELVDLYDSFINKKFTIYQKEKNQVDLTKAGIIEDKEKLYKKFVRRHQRLGIHRMFNEKDLQYLVCEKILHKIELFLHDVFEGKERTGIIDGVVDDKPHFIHRTFAEYFAAHFLISLLEEQNQNENIRKFLFTDILMKPEFEVIRAFMNDLLKKNQWSYKTVTEYGKVLETLWKSGYLRAPKNNNETILHIASVEGNLMIIKFLVDCMKDCTNVFLEFINAKDKYNRTVLHDASAIRNWDIVKFLITEGVDPTVTDELGGSVLQTAVNCGILDMVKWLMIDRGLHENSVDTDGNTLLHHAVLSGNLDLVKWLVHEHRANINESNYEGQTILHYSVKSDNLELVKWLVKEGASPSCVTINGSSVLHEAVIFSSCELVQWLVKEANLDVNLMTKRRDSVLLYASGAGHLDTVQWLIENGADVNVSNKSGVTPLLRAIATCNWNIAKFLIENGSDVNVRSKDGKSVVFSAAIFGKWNIVKFLIEEKNVNLNDDIKFGWSVFHYAASRNKWDMVKWLISRKFVEINSKDKNSNTVLHYAALYGDLHLVLWLLGENADLNIINKEGHTILYNAVLSENIKLVRYLLEENTLDMTVADNFGKTVLHIAAQKGNLDLVKLLAEKSCCLLLIKNKDESTILHQACNSGNFKLVKWLISQKKMSLNPVDIKGFSILHEAASSGNLKLVKWLIDEKGMDFKLRTESGETALHRASIRSNWEVVRWLVEEKNGDVNDRDYDGRSLLHNAAFFCLYNEVKWLVQKHNINVNFKDINGKTALDIARQSPPSYTYEIIIQYLAARTEE